MISRFIMLSLLVVVIGACQSTHPIIKHNYDQEDSLFTAYYRQLEGTASISTPCDLVEGSYLGYLAKGMHDAQITLEIKRPSSSSISGTYSLNGVEPVFPRSDGLVQGFTSDGSFEIQLRPYGDNEKIQLQGHCQRRENETRKWIVAFGNDRSSILPSIFTLIRKQ